MEISFNLSAFLFFTVARSYDETTKSTPIFFVLSPGVDPLKEVESLGRKLGFTADNGKFHNISLGQGS